MTEQHPLDDQLLALALDDLNDLNESGRVSVLDHLSTCHRCRREYDAVSSTIEQTLAAAPSVEPPPGFDARVLAAMGFDEVDSGSPRDARRPGGWHRWPLLAASVVLGLVLGAAGALGWSQLTEDQEGAIDEDVAWLSTGDGEHVGTVTSGTVDGEPSLVVTVTSGPIGMEYLCVVRLDDGRQLEVGTWTLRTERAESWVVVDAPVDEVTEVALIAHGGAGPLWSSAEL